MNSKGHLLRWKYKLKYDGIIFVQKFSKLLTLIGREIYYCLFCRIKLFVTGVNTRLDMKIDTILHVGMSKCGSSALQTALTSTPDFISNAGDSIKYIAISDRTLEIFNGIRLIEHADKIRNYAVSGSNIFKLASSDPSYFSKLKSNLQELRSLHLGKIIISNEGYGLQFELLKKTGILEKLELDCEVIIYIRPQVLWMNSAWWQWGAWENLSLNQFILKRLPSIMWGDLARFWQAVPGVKKVTVRLLRGDVVSDFFSIVGAPPKLGSEINKGLPARILRLFQRHRELRPTKSSSGIDFLITKNCKFNDPNPPWVLSDTDITFILNNCLPSNRALEYYLEGEQQSLLRNDAAWWSPGHYSTKVAEFWGKVDSEDNEADDVLLALINGLIKLNGVNEKLLKNINN